jgi:hypothetical protein
MTVIPEINNSFRTHYSRKNSLIHNNMKTQTKAMLLLLIYIGR